MVKSKMFTIWLKLGHKVLVQFRGTACLYGKNQQGKGNVEVRPVFI